MAYLTENQIDILAEEAVTNYEVSGSWSAAYRAVAEYAADDFGWQQFQRNTPLLLAVKRAKLIWQAETIRVKAAIA
jgi:hypothetical protein